eukprot:6189247-Pleurochrysis_carterae.AAC.7
MVANRRWPAIGYVCLKEPGDGEGRTRGRGNYSGVGSGGTAFEQARVHRVKEEIEGCDAIRTVERAREEEKDGARGNSGLAGAGWIGQGIRCGRLRCALSRWYSRWLIRTRVCDSSSDGGIGSGYVRFPGIGRFVEVHFRGQNDTRDAGHPDVVRTG